MTTPGRNSVALYLVLLAVFMMAQPLTQTYALVSYGNQNVEQWASTIGGDLVQAYTKITISKPTVNVQVAIARANFLNRMDRYS